MVPFSGGHLCSIAISCAILNTIFIAGRLISRFAIKHSQIGWDDVCAVLGYIACLGMSAIGIVAVKVGRVGYHVQDALAMDPESLVYWSQSVFAQEWIYLAAVSLPKLSILALYLRIWPTSRARIAIKILMGLVMAYWVAFQVAACLQCIPLQGLWDKSIPARCFDTQAFFNFVSLPSAIIDLMIIVFPIPLLARLQAPVGKRCIYIGLFFCGSLGIIADLVRIVLFLRISAYADPTWASVYLIGVTVVEPTLYLFAACLVSMFPVYQFVAERLWSGPIKSAWHRFCDEKMPQSWKSRLPKSWTRGAPRLPPPVMLSRTEWFETTFSRVTAVSKVEGGYLEQGSMIGLQDGIGIRREVWVESTPRHGSTPTVSSETSPQRSGNQPRTSADCRR